MRRTPAHIVSAAVIVSLLSSAALVVVPSSIAGAAGAVLIIADPDSGPCEQLAPDVFECSLADGVALANSHPGSTVMLTAGQYPLGSPLTVTQNGTTIVGAGGVRQRAADYAIDANGGKGLIVDADDVRITGVTITNAGNSNGDGGAILVKRNADRFHLVDSSIESSAARSGGGMHVDGTAVIESSTFVGNSASRKGGAVRVAGVVEIVNSTFTENVAQSGGAVSVAGTAAISFSTFVDNTSNNQKGGGVDRNGGTVFVTGSILTRANQQSTDGSDCSGSPDLIGPNYVGNAQGCNPDSSVLIGTDVGPLQIGALGDYLGPTRTIPVTDGSVVIDAADPDSCREIGLDGVVDGGDPVVDSDQRGTPRPSGAGCDLGAYERSPLTIDLELTADTATPFVGARFLPSAAIAESVIATDSLFGGSLEASPLNAFPLESAPLNAFPLNAFPLNAFPLNAFPLNAFFTAAVPLNAFPLNAFPLNAFPLNAFPLSDLVLTDGTWEALLVGTSFEGVPLQSLTLDDVQGVSGVRGLSLGELNLEGTPLNVFPLNAFLLGSVPLNAFPLNAFRVDDPTVTDWCDVDAFAEFCVSGGVDPTDDRFTLASVALAGVPLNAFPLNAFPLNAFPLNAFPLNAFPLNAFPLNAFAWTASPLNAFPLNAFPLNAFDGGAVIDCGKLPGGTCDGATLFDAFAAGAFAGDAALGDLGALFQANPNAYAALGDFTLADLLIGLIPSDSIPWNEIDLTIPGIQNSAPSDEWTFHYLASLTLTAPAASLTVQLELPPGFAYVPGGTTLDDAPVADPTLSCPDGSCIDTDGDPLPITLTFELSNVPPGTPVLEIATRAGFELGTYTATAAASAQETNGSTPVTAGPSTYPVTVIAPPDAPTSPVVIQTAGINPCLGEGIGDVNLGWVASSTDGVDYYRFDVSPEAAACGVRADIFLSNAPVDLDLTLYGEKSDPLRGEPIESIAYLDDVTLDLNPSDDVVQADTAQDIPQVLPAAFADPDTYAVTAISSNRGLNPERIRTGTLRAGTHYLQVTGYNGARADTPYALRLRIDGTVARDACSALPYPGVGSVDPIAPGTLPAIGTLPTDLNTLFLVNTQLLEFTYSAADRADILAKLSAVATAADVVGTVLPIEADPTVQAAFRARAAQPCDPERSNDVVRAIGDLIAAYSTAQPEIEVDNVVIVGDDRQIPMANIVDDANFANERTFSQEFTGDSNNESIAALAAGTYRSDDPYGTDAGIRIRDHELFVPTRAVGRLVESPAEIIAYLDNFLTFDGQLDPDTEQRTALQTGYEFLADGAQLNVDNLEAAGYQVDTLIDETWTDGDLVTGLTRTPTEAHLDVIGIHAHFDEDNALPAFDNFNPPVSQDELFNSSELPDNVRRAVVYSMGCHSGYSLSDIQVGVGPGTTSPDDTAPDWAQVVTGDRANVFAGNTGFGYGDTDRVALTEQLTAIFADEVGQDGSVGQAWVDAKQRMLSEILVLDAYQEKALQQFVLYGLPMFRVGPAAQPAGGAAAPLAVPASATPDNDPNTGQPIASLEFVGAIGSTDPDVPEFRRIDGSGGSYYAVDGRTLNVNGHPVQPLYAQTAPAFDGLRARDALITDMTSVDVGGVFDPLFFWASPNFGGPRPEYFDGSFPAEMAAVRSFVQDGEQRQQVLIAAGQFRADDSLADSGVQRLHTRVEAEVYYSASDDFTAPTIARSTGAFDSDAVRFEVDVDDTARRVYVLYRATGDSEWSGLDLAPFGDVWTGVGPFAPSSGDKVEFIVQAVDDNGNVAMSNNKSQYFLETTPGEISALVLTASPETGQFNDPWYTGDVRVSATNGAGDVEYRIDAGPYLSYPNGGVVIPADDTGVHVITAFDSEGDFAALVIRIDSAGPSIDIQRSPAEVWSNEPVTITISADDEGLSGIAAISYSLDGQSPIIQDFPQPPAGAPNQSEQVSFVMDTDGIASITASAIDVAGNVSDEATSTTQIDTVAPTVTVTRSPDEEWSNEPVTVTVAAADDASGVAAINYSANGAAFVPYDGPVVVNVDGTTTIAAKAVDVAGNEGTAASDIVIRIDTVGPVVPTLIVAPTVDVGQSASATYSCGDDLSGVQSCEIAVIDPTGSTQSLGSDPNGGTVLLPTGELGSYTVQVTVTDLAGNVTVETAGYEVVDTTPPAVTLTIFAPTVAVDEPNAVDFSCADAQSGIVSCTVTVLLPGGASQNLNPIGATSGSDIPLPTSLLGTYEVTVAATDGAGNMITGMASYDVVDTTPPLVVVTLESPIGTPYGAEWTNQTVTASVDASDAGSGLASVEYSVDGGDFVAYVGAVAISMDGEHTFVARAADNADNITTADPATIRIDRQAPTATLSLSANQIETGSSAPVTATYDCDDQIGLSGIVSCVIEVAPVPTGGSNPIFVTANPADLPRGSGSYLVRVTATDNAGNASSVTDHYEVLRTLCVNELYNFAQPKNIGSNYTIKVELLECASGANISSRRTVLTAFAITDFPASTNSYAPGANDSGNANDGFEFRYSSREGYIYNLDTTGFDGPAGTYTLDFTAVDQNGVVIGIGHARFTLAG